MLLVFSKCPTVPGCPSHLHVMRLMSTVSWQQLLLCVRGSPSLHPGRERHPGHSWMHRQGVGRQAGTLHDPLRLPVPEVRSALCSFLFLVLKRTSNKTIINKNKTRQTNSYCLLRVYSEPVFTPALFWFILLNSPNIHIFHVRDEEADLKSVRRLPGSHVREGAEPENPVPGGPRPHPLQLCPTLVSGHRDQPLSLWGIHSRYKLPPTLSPPCCVFYKFIA